MTPRRTATLCIAIGCAGLAAVYVASRYQADAAAKEAAATPVAEVSTRKAFLAGRDLPDGTWLLLTPRAFGGGDDGPAFRVIRDTAALRAAAPTVWVEDDQDARTRVVLLSIAFLSPGVPDESFATLLYPDGRQEQITAYYDLMADAATPRSNLGNLMALSSPVLARNALLQDAVAYDALVTQVAQDPDLFFLDPPWKPDFYPVYPIEAGISFPSLLLKATELTDQRVKEEIARVLPAFAATLGAPGPGYDLTYITQDFCETPEVWHVGRAAPVMIGDQPLTLPGFALLTVTAKLSATPEIMARLSDVAPAFAPPAQTDPAADAALVAALAAHVPGANPADYRVRNDCWTRELAVSWASPNGVSPQYFEIVTDSP
jgi:hypothetical protein